MARLDLGIIQDAFMFPFRNPLAVLRLGLFPVLIVLTAAHVAIYLLILFASEMTSSGLVVSGLWTLLLLLVYPLVISGFAAGVCRLIVKGEAPGWSVPQLGRRERPCAAALLVFLLLTVGAQALFAGIGWIGEVVHEAEGRFAALTGLAFAALSAAAFLAALCVCLRLVLILPHAAVTGEVSLKTSWDALDGNFWRFAAAIVILSGLGAVFSLLLMAPIMIGGALASDVLAPDYGPWFLTVRMIMLMPVTLLMLSMLLSLAAYAYRDLVPRDSAPHEGNAAKSVDEWRGAAISHG